MPGADRFPSGDQCGGDGGGDLRDGRGRRGGDVFRRGSGGRDEGGGGGGHGSTIPRNSPLKR
ncbi:hypothetical protein C1J00_12290 [Streptomyces cahuitamycinicus]|uniref:Uncharacterized protein n=1 Tax=Streptomyces cahuitamycinicus TaxID=2070367 RepID=A0A2N8TSC5_9ACTN|nr:hypothetical protein C1J00_12290 [Streptomyces cahuitamycinicus]